MWPAKACPQVLVLFILQSHVARKAASPREGAAADLEVNARSLAYQHRSFLPSRARASLELACAPMPVGAWVVCRSKHEGSSCS